VISTDAACRGIADRLVDLARDITGGEIPVRIRAWDGSEAGPASGPVLVLRDRAALRRVLWHPRELGLAQAYIAGEIDVDGDLAEALGRLLSHFRQTSTTAVRLGGGQLLRALALAVRMGILGPPPPAPLATAKLSGAVHSRERDRAAVAHHYDLSNEFYQLLLDPSMAYSCAYWASDAPGYTLADAQRDKLKLICARLALGPATRLLDVGCGWGTLSLYAARYYGTQVTAVTLSEQQWLFVTGRVAELGLGDLVDVRLQDYRDVNSGPYDAVAVVEMGEHVGKERYGVFAGRLTRLLRPSGRLLIQQMSRGQRVPSGGRFISAYIASDMYMRPVGETICALERAGLEVREVHAMREHYVPTILAWLATLERRWNEVVQLVGEPTGRVWRLYLAGAALAFQERRMGVDQILAIRPPDHSVEVPRAE
jgi:cyclopropane-fatty-acyl-phospholipid synthase